MNGWRKAIAGAIIVSFLPGGSWVGTGLAAASPSSEETKASVPSKIYRMAGAPNPDEARRVVERLGVGHHVATKRKGKTFRGFIQDIQHEYFVLQLDGEAGHLNLVYSEVELVRPNPSTGGKVAIIAAVAAAAALLIKAIIDYRDIPK
jgi:hypothetical protein